MVPRRRRVVPLAQHLLPRRRAQHRHRRYPRRRRPHQPRQQHPELLPQPHDRRPIEQVRVVLNPPREAALPVPQREGHVELRRFAVDHVRQDAQAREADFALLLRIQEEKHHLRQRRAAQVAFGPQGIDDTAERHVLVRVRPDGDVANASEQRVESRIAAHVGAEHQVVDEEPEQMLELGLVAVGNRRAHDDPLLSGEPEEQRLEDREQCYERRQLVTKGQRPHELRVLGRQRQRLPESACGLHVRARMITRQLDERGSIRQGPAPVLELGVEHSRAQPAPLPHREVRVLNRQGLQRRRPAFTKGGVERRELAIEGVERDPVGDDMVEGGGADELFVIHLQQHRAEERKRGEVEGAADVRHRQPLGLAFAIGWRH